MGWLRTDYQFPNRACKLILGRRDAIDLGLEAAIRDLPRDFKDAQSIETWWRAILAIHRPDLDNATIWYMDFDHSRLVWFVCIEHPSLPEICPASELPCVRLCVDHEPVET